MLTELEGYIHGLNQNLKSIGIKTGKIINIDINSRATKRMGMCKKIKGGYKIEISKFILSDRKELIDTIYHDTTYC